jgi:hypothetical protein
MPPYIRRGNHEERTLLPDAGRQPRQFPQHTSPAQHFVFSIRRTYRYFRHPSSSLQIFERLLLSPKNVTQIIQANPPFGPGHKPLPAQNAGGRYKSKSHPAF